MVVTSHFIRRQFSQTKHYRTPRLTRALSRPGNYDMIGHADMNQSKLNGYHVAGELYGKLRAKLDGGRLAMSLESTGSFDFRWTFRIRRQHTVNQTVKLQSLETADEIDTLVDLMIANLKGLASKVSS